MEQDFTRPNQAPKPTQIYSFNHVFGPETPQNTFFETTTLPLVEQALQGESGLMFSYGVSNSGKTYTIQGGGDDTTQGADRGMIPRSIDVIFNSIEGLECTIPVSPFPGFYVIMRSNDCGVNRSNLYDNTVSR